MDHISNHKKAVEYANQATYIRFKKPGPYTPNTPENSFWLTMYDEYISGCFLSSYHREVL